MSQNTLVSVADGRTHFRWKEDCGGRGIGMWGTAFYAELKQNTKKKIKI